MRNFLFADDTSMVAHFSDYVEKDQVLTDTLKEWGETVKPQKTKRVAITTNFENGKM